MKSSNEKQLISRMRPYVETKDNYPTPRWCVESLIEKEEQFGGFPGLSYEPACGCGGIVLPFRERGLRIVGSDLREDNIAGCGGVDFMKMIPKSAPMHCITNPPYKLAFEFVKKMYSISEWKTCIFVRMAWLAAMKRYDFFTSVETKPSRMYFFSKRPQLHLEHDDKPTGGGTIDYCWIVWDKKDRLEHFDWIDGKWHAKYGNEVMGKAV